MIKLLVIADDLTGALDTGVQFARQGISTFVTVYPGINISSLPPGLEVLVVDTESRHLAAVEAANGVRKIVESGRRAGVNYFYKKTDSTLRGNIGAELEAALEASGRKTLCFIPAFPKAGRFTREGIHYLENEPVHLTRFGLDPLDPVETSSIVEILASQSKIQAAPVRVDELNNLGAMLRGDVRFLAFDCSSDFDLDKIGVALKNHGLLGMTAGSAGFAAVLPDMLELHRSRETFLRPEEPVLILNGSLNETSLEQVRHAEKEGVRTYGLSQEMLLDSTPEVAGKIRVLALVLAREAAAGRSVILRSFSERDYPDDPPMNICQKQDIKDVCFQVSRNLGKIISAVLREARFGSLAVFGGDTLVGVLEALRARGIHPFEEVAPGIVVSQMIGSDLEIPLISKAGGFGEKDVIMQIISYLKGNRK